MQKNHVHEIKVLFSYFENIIPKRCRKARRVRFDDGEFVVKITKVSEADAPVAIRSKGKFTFKKDESYSVEYRWYAGHLWTAVNLSDSEPKGRYSGQDNWDYPSYPDKLDLRSENSALRNYDYGLYSNKYQSKADAIAYLEQMAENNIIIDGVPYRPAGEPRYVAMTFGLGNNHGGTAVMIDNSYNGNIAASSYFSLLDRDKAIAKATEMATARGDYKSLPIIPHGPEWVILIPKAIQVVPEQQHGDGDPFLNKLQEVTLNSGGNAIVALAGVLGCLANP
jgi:hypothetical protein